MDAHESRSAFALLVKLPDAFAYHPRSCHDDIEIRSRLDPVERDVVCGCEVDDRTGLEVRSDVLLVDLRSDLIGKQHEDDISLGAGLCDGIDHEAVLIGLIV